MRRLGGAGGGVAEAVGMLQRGMANDERAVRKI